MIEDSCSWNKRLMFHSSFKGIIAGGTKPPSFDSSFKGFPISLNTCDLEGPTIYMQTDSKIFEHFYFINFICYVKSISSFYIIYGLKVIMCFPPS